MMPPLIVLAVVCVYRVASLAVPLLTRVLPADVCSVRKRGTRLRLDSSLMSFGLAELTWRRGDLTFLFNAPLPASSSLHGCARFSRLLPALSYCLPCTARFVASNYRMTMRLHLRV